MSQGVTHLQGDDGSSARWHGTVARLGAAGHAGAMGKSMHTTEEVEGKQYSRQSVTECIISKPVLLYFSSI